MGLTSTFTEPFFTGGATSSVVPSIFDCAIDGRGYMLDTSQAGPGLKWSSIPLIRQQADQSDTPGEQSLNPEDLWRRSVDTWHKGAGQTYLDAPDSEAGMFRSSRGIDPWTLGEISLLPDTLQKTNTGNSVVALTVAGSALYLLDGDSLSYTNDITVGTPSFTNVTGVGFDEAKAIASDGYTVWVIDNVDLYSTVRNTATYDSWSSDPLPGSLVRYVKGRLLVASDRKIWNPGAQGDPLPPDPVFEHPNVDWQWTDIGEGPNAIYLAGFAGDKSIIYRTAFDTAIADLDVPTVAATLPDGEIVRTIEGYLGFVLIGTDQGLRFAAAQNNGDLELGDLIDIGPVTCFEPQGRFVWFSWSNYDIDFTGLGRVDLRTLNGTQPAYASDLMANTQGTTTSVATFQGLRVFTVAASGVWCESANRVLFGTIDSGLIGYSLSTSKTALFLETQHRRGEGKFQAFLAADESAFVSVGAAVETSGNVAGTETTTVGQIDGELFEVRYALAQTTSPSETPVLGRFTLRVDPHAARRDKIQLPILLYPELYPVSGTTERLSPRTERDAIRALARTRRPVTCQLGLESSTVIIEDFEWTADQNLRHPSFDYSGMMLVVAKTIA